jgi:hypothetical protein
MPAGEDERQVVEQHRRDREERPDGNAERAGSEEEKHQDEDHGPDAETGQDRPSLAGAAPGEERLVEQDRLGTLPVDRQERGGPERDQAARPQRGLHLRPDVPLPAVGLCLAGEPVAHVEEHHGGQEHRGALERLLMAGAHGEEGPDRDRRQDARQERDAARPVDHAGFVPVAGLEKVRDQGRDDQDGLETLAHDEDQPVQKGSPPAVGLFQERRRLTDSSLQRLHRLGDGIGRLPGDDRAADVREARLDLGLASRGAGRHGGLQPLPLEEIEVGAHEERLGPLAVAGTVSLPRLVQARGDLRRQRRRRDRGRGRFRHGPGTVFLLGEGCRRRPDPGELPCVVLQRLPQRRDSLPDPRHRLAPPHRLPDLPEHLFQVLARRADSRRIATSMPRSSNAPKYASPARSIAPAGSFASYALTARSSTLETSRAASSQGTGAAPAAPSATEATSRKPTATPAPLPTLARRVIAVLLVGPRAATPARSVAERALYIGMMLPNITR